MKKFIISADLKFLFEEKVNKLANKFNKYGNCTYVFSEPFIDENKNSPSFGKKMIEVDVEAAYKIEGYTFVASLEWIDSAQENLIKKISDDVFVPAVYKTRTECDHCKTNRYRKYSILLKDIHDNYIQVGKSCVRDYLGVDLSNYAAYLSFFSDLEDFIASHNQDKLARSKDYFNVEEVLCQAIEETQRHGYISKKQAIENNVDGTASRVWMAFNKSRSLDGEILYERYPLTAELKEKALEVKNFFLDSDTSSSSDYIANIKTILKIDWVDGSQLPLVVSAVGTKLRLENEKKNSMSKPEYQFATGKCGDKIEFIGKPQCLYSTESTYGWFYIYRIETSNTIFIWKTSKSLDTETLYNFKGTIKNFDLYNNEKQTEITRVRVSEVSA